MKAVVKRFTWRAEPRETPNGRLEKQATLPPGLCYGIQLALTRYHIVQFLHPMPSVEAPTEKNATMNRSTVGGGMRQGT